MDAKSTADWLNTALKAVPPADLDRLLLGSGVEVDVPAVDAAERENPGFVLSVNPEGRLTALGLLNSLLYPSGELVAAHYADAGNLLYFSCQPRAKFFPESAE